MKEKIIKNRKNILLTIAFLLALAFNIGMRYLATRPRYKTLPEVKLVNQKETSTKGFAIMVPNDSGDGYVEYEGDTWPSEEEGYEFKEAKCIDDNGSLVNNVVTFADGKVTLNTDRTIYCTLYFDEKIEPLEITNVVVDNSKGGRVILTIETRGGNGDYTYSVEISCYYGTGDNCGRVGGLFINYNENIITVDNLDPCYSHSFNIKVTDSNGNFDDYNVSNIGTPSVSGWPC